MSKNLKIVFSFLVIGFGSSTNVGDQRPPASVQSVGPGGPDFANRSRSRGKRRCQSGAGFRIRLPVRRPRTFRKGQLGPGFLNFWSGPKNFPKLFRCIYFRRFCLKFFRCCETGFIFFSIRCDPNRLFGYLYRKCDAFCEPGIGMAILYSRGTVNPRNLDRVETNFGRTLTH